MRARILIPILLVVALFCAALAGVVYSNVSTAAIEFVDKQLESTMRIAENGVATHQSAGGSASEADYQNIVRGLGVAEGGVLVINESGTIIADSLEVMTGQQVNDQGWYLDVQQDTTSTFKASLGKTEVYAYGALYDGKVFVSYLPYDSVSALFVTPLYVIVLVGIVGLIALGFIIYFIITRLMISPLEAFEDQIDEYVFTNEIDIEPLKRSPELVAISKQLNEMQRQPHRRAYVPSRSAVTKAAPSTAQTKPEQLPTSVREQAKQAASAVQTKPEQLASSAREQAKQDVSAIQSKLEQAAPVLHEQKKQESPAVQTQKPQETSAPQTQQAEPALTSQPQQDETVSTLQSVQEKAALAAQALQASKTPEAQSDRAEVATPAPTTVQAEPVSAPKVEQAQQTPVPKAEQAQQTPAPKVEQAQQTSVPKAEQEPTPTPKVAEPQVQQPEPAPAPQAKQPEPAAPAEKTPVSQGAEPTAAAPQAAQPAAISEPAAPAPQPEPTPAPQPKQTEPAAAPESTGPTRFELVSLLREIFKQHQQTIASKKIKFSLMVSNDMPEHIVANREALNTSMSNMLDDALISAIAGSQVSAKASYLNAATLGRDDAAILFEVHYNSKEESILLDVKEGG